MQNEYFARWDGEVKTIKLLSGYTLGTLAEVTERVVEIQRFAEASRPIVIFKVKGTGGIRVCSISP